MKREFSCLQSLLRQKIFVNKKITNITFFSENVYEFYNGMLFSLLKDPTQSMSQYLY